ncbi:dual specificity protein phosphatase 23 isoform X3 [Callithrix jacchus]
MMIQPITAYPSREGRDRGASLGSSEPGFRVSAPPQALGQSRRRGRASPGTAPRRPRGPEGAGASDSCPGLTLHRLRIPDFCPPAPEQIDRFVQIVDEANARGERACYVPRRGGLGTTETAPRRGTPRVLEKSWRLQMPDSGIFWSTLFT